MSGSERKFRRRKEYGYSLGGAYFLNICVEDRRCLLGMVTGTNVLIRPCERGSGAGALFWQRSYSNHIIRDENDCLRV